MPALPVTTLYAVLLAVIGIALMLRVVAMRFQSGVSILHGDDLELARSNLDSGPMHPVPPS